MEKTVNHEQLTFADDGSIKGAFEHKVECAIKRIQSYAAYSTSGYYVAFSGGKDSQCVYHLCKMAGAPFHAHYNMTSVDPPELVNFIREHYPDVLFERQHYDDGKPEHYYKDGRSKPITMWSLIADNRLPPIRRMRYCCRNLKEAAGGADGEIVVTGVRWAESPNRANNHGIMDVHGKPKTTQKIADAVGANYKLNGHGDITLNYDSDGNRRLVEICLRTNRLLLNPIVDWSDDDVWRFLDSNGIEHCCLYDEGFKRLGCIGCPLSGTKHMIRDFERWPKYKEMYIRAFERMIERHPGQIKILGPNADTKSKLLDETDAGGQSVLQQHREAEYLFNNWVEGRLLPVRELAGDM